MMNEKKKEYKTVARTVSRYLHTTLAHWPIMLLGVASAVGYSFFLSFANPRIVASIVDIVGQGNVAADQVFTVFGPYILMLIGTNLIGQVCSKLQDYGVWKLQILGSYDLSTLVFDTISTQSMTFHNSRFGGSLVSQTTKFTNAYSLLVQTMLYAVLPLLSSTVFTIVLLLPLVPAYVGVLSGLLVIYVIVVFSMFRRLIHINNRTAGAQNRLSGELSDSIMNILAVKTYGREDYERGLFAKANDEVRDVGSRGMRFSLLSAGIAAAIIVVIMSALTLFIAGGNAWFGISAGTLVMMYSYTYSLTMSYNNISVVLRNVNQALGDAHDMTKILDEPTLVEDVPHAKELIVSDGKIDFSDINFRYTDANELTYIFRDFGLHVRAGERIGLVGRSGSGKTTLTRLLLRLADIQEGSITIDGQDISKVTQVSLRKQIAYVPQEPLLFHRTVAENIAYGKPDAGMDEIRAAAKQANALSFIEKLPEGFETITGERGVKLSGGQRQRIAIARAILADTPILVLDEATSALDSESEQLIQQALVNLMKGRTCIVVAHRLSTVASLDRIIVLEDGRIAEGGSHQELLTRGGIYASLWDRQTGAFFSEFGEG